MTDKVDDLERAILAQAERLADQYREQARHSSDDILRAARERLHLREEREVLQAKAEAERAYRRRVLSKELAMQAKLDALRWELVRGVEERTLEALRAIAQDADRYLELIVQLVANGVQAFDATELVIESNGRDHALLATHAGQLQAAAGDTHLSLGEQSLDCSGGILLHTPDDRERLDQTFEGRMHRLAGELQRVIQETLLPDSPEDLNRNIVS